MSNVKQDQILASLASFIGNRNPNQDFSYLNGNDAPNSWTILDKTSKKVWKIIKPTARIKENPFLEKQALDSISENSLVIKYEAEGQISIVGLKTPQSYLVFPFIENASPLNSEIFQRKKAGKSFSDGEISNIASQLVKAIHYMYQGGVVHQDIKPGNILLKEDGSLVVIDLGIAKFVNEDLKLIKSMKGPYAYLSPERLDMIAKLSDSTKRKLSFPSDLFSVGMILFELATLQRLTNLIQPGEIRSAHSKLEELGVRKSLVDLISQFMNESPLKRQSLVSENFKLKWFKPNTQDKHEIWIQHHSNGFPFIQDFLNSYIPKNGYGVVLAGDQLQSEESSVKNSQFIKSKGGKLAVDPGVFRLAYSDDHHGHLANRTYGHVISPNYFLKDTFKQKAETFIKEVIDFQELLEVDLLISPYFMIDRVSEQWFEANFKAFNMTRKYLEAKNIQKPLYFGIMLSERVMSSGTDLEEIVTHILLDESIQNIYIRVESNRSGSEPNEDSRFLNNLKSLIKILSASKNIFLGFADLEVFGYLGKGLCSFGINPDFEKRKSNIIDQYSKPREEIKRQPSRKRYFAQNLWNDVLAEVELKNPSAVSRGSEKVFTCNCQFCTTNGKDRRLDVDASRKHFIYHMDNFLLEINKMSTSKEKSTAFLKKLNQAREAYEFLETTCGMKFDKSTDASFIPVWEKVFAS